MATDPAQALRDAEANLALRRQRIQKDAENLGLKGSQLESIFDSGVDFQKVESIFKDLRGQTNQDVINKTIGDRFSHADFNPFREAGAADKVRVETGARRQRGFTGALRGGRAFLARERTDDQNDRPFLGG